MSSSNPNYNARRGYATADSQQQQTQPSSLGNHQSGLRRSHLYTNRGNTFNPSADSENTLPHPVATHSRLDGTGPNHTNLSSRNNTNNQSRPLPTAGEYFAKEQPTSGPGAQSQASSAPWARSAGRFSHKSIHGLPSSSSYGLPPTPESDVSQSRIVTPPRQHRDYQFNVGMMQRMTQHAKISPLNQYSNLKRELAEDNLVVDGGNVDRLVARAGERTSATSRGYEPTSSDQLPARRVAFRSPEAVEGAREASRRLNGASTIDRPSSMYEVTSKPFEQNPTSNMYDELKRTLSESSSERPKRIVRSSTSQRQLPPLSPVQRRHVEIRPRRPAGVVSGQDSHTPPPQQNNYYPQETRPRTAPSQEEPAAGIDWLAAAQNVAEETSQKPAARRRPRTSSSGTPIANTALHGRHSEEFGGELRPDSSNIRTNLPTSHAADTSIPERTEQRLSPLNNRSAPNNSYHHHELLDFVSEDDLTVNLTHGDRSPIAFRGSGLRTADASIKKRPGTSGTNKPQDISFLQNAKQTDPDETLDTLRQLSRLLSGNTPVKQEGRKIVELAASKPLEAIRSSTTVDSRQPYKRQTRPMSNNQTPKNEYTSSPGLDSKPTEYVQQGNSGSSKTTDNTAQTQSHLRGSVPYTRSRPSAATPSVKTNSHSKKPSESKTSTSKTIQFEDGYETDDSLDRLLSHDTDYASLLKPAVYEDESFLQATVQVANQSPPSRNNDLETLALRTRLLNNLQTVQLDIRETRKGLEAMERKFGMLEDESMSTTKPLEQTILSPTLPQSTTAPRHIVFLPRRRQKLPSKGLFWKPWGFKDYFCATLLILFCLVAIEYKMW
ncbi:hypothetical protein ABW20_dc0101412 [Dactylellina cionopaga]|nr:hypothetical protein ABW20_dc0101412 [Dactylellina cionopaga]